VPVSQSSPHNSRRGICFLRDRFFRFWLALCTPIARCWSGVVARWCSINWSSPSCTPWWRPYSRASVGISSGNRVWPEGCRSCRWVLAVGGGSMRRSTWLFLARVEPCWANANGPSDRWGWISCASLSASRAWCRNWNDIRCTFALFSRGGFTPQLVEPATSSERVFLFDLPVVLSQASPSSRDSATSPPPIRWDRSPSICAVPTRWAARSALPGPG